MREDTVSLNYSTGLDVVRVASTTIELGLPTSHGTVITDGDEPEGAVDSFLCLTGWHNKFVKFRLTTRPSPRSSAEARRFVEAWLKILWP